jgi:hypothetical protein
MYIFFEYAACMVLVVFAVTLLFAGCALLIILKEGAAILRRLARGIAHDARILVARQTVFVRSGRSTAGFGLRLNQHEEVSVSRRLPCSRC